MGFMWGLYRLYIGFCMGSYQGSMHRVVIGFNRVLQGFIQGFAQGFILIYFFFLSIDRGLQRCAQGESRGSVAGFYV